MDNAIHFIPHDKTQKQIIKFWFLNQCVSSNGIEILNFSLFSIIQDGLQRVNQIPESL